MNLLARRMAAVKALAMELSTERPFFVVNEVSFSSWNLKDKNHQFFSILMLREIFKKEITYLLTTLFPVEIWKI